MRIGIVARPGSEDRLDVARRILKHLAGRADVVLDRVLAGTYALDERMKLEVRRGGTTYPAALNEAVIRSARTGRMIQVAISVAGHEVERFRGDGVIVSTPTGSTGYAMSAGGPILDPHMEAVLVVPLAPFKLSARPMVFPPRRPLAIELLPSTNDAVLVLDGDEEIGVAAGERVELVASREKGRFVRFDDAYLARAKQRLV